MLKISKGQFNCGSDDCVVHIKFDDGKIQVFSASEPSDGSTGVLFIQPYGRFLNALKRSKHVKIEAEYFKEGLQTLFFDIPTLDIPK